MKSSIRQVGASQLEISFCVDISGSLLEAERKIQDALNDAGAQATGRAIERCDSNGEPISIAGVKFYSKSQVPKCYQTPYGEIEIKRHVYQTAKGGKTFCPLEQRAKIIGTATPFFAKQISSKVAECAASVVRRDLIENHGRAVSKEFVQNTAEAVGSIAQAKEADWEYELPKFKDEVSSISVSLDGVMMQTVDDGWREAMVGSLSYYGLDGTRLHTTYCAATPEYGKETFFERLDREIERSKELFTEDKVKYVGIADGARGNWKFLNKRTEVQITDFFHAAEYISQAAEACFNSRQAEDKREWTETVLHDLKHASRGASTALRKLKALEESAQTNSARETVSQSISYLSNQKQRMKYASYRENGYPIGSGVTESACKMLVKQRLCQSGMRWKEKGAATILSIRSLVRTEGRWDQFWQKIDDQCIVAA